MEPKTYNGICKLARQTTRQYPELYDDAVQDGCLAALESGKPDDTPVIRLLGEMRDGMRRDLFPIKVPKGQYAEWFIREKYARDAKYEDVSEGHDTLYDEQTCDHLLGLIKNETTREMVRLYFVEDMTFQEIAQRYGYHNKTSVYHRIVDAITFLCNHSETKRLK